MSTTNMNEFGSGEHTLDLPIPSFPAELFVDEEPTLRNIDPLPPWAPDAA